MSAVVANYCYKIEQISGYDRKYFLKMWSNDIIKCLDVKVNDDELAFKMNRELCLCSMDDQIKQYPFQFF